MRRRRSREPAVAVPTVSVVVPTYQRREFVQRAVASVLAQSRRDFELIVVDDGSTDGTGDALRGLDERLRYHWQLNRGVAAARNAGIRLARGEIVAFLDSDDRWLRDHLAVVSEVLARHPDAVLCATCPRYYTDGRQRADEATPLDAVPLVLVENVVGWVPGVAARRSALLAVGGFEERLAAEEGRELWMRLATQGPFVLLRRRTVIYQKTRGSLSERSRRSGNFVRTFDVLGKTALSLACLDRPDRSDLGRRAKGFVRYLEATRALVEGDHTAARKAFADACAALPELSHEPALITYRLSSRATLSGKGRVRILATAATLWPEQSSPTAVYLRVFAICVAMRAGSAIEAYRLLRRWPHAAGPRALGRLLPILVRDARRIFQDRMHRGNESTELTDL